MLEYFGDQVEKLEHIRLTNDFDKLKKMSDKLFTKNEDKLIFFKEILPMLKHAKTDNELLLLWDVPQETLESIKLELTYFQNSINRTEIEIERINALLNSQKSVNPYNNIDQETDIPEKIRKLNWYGKIDQLLFMFIRLKEMGKIEESDLKHICSFIVKVFYDRDKNKEYEINDLTSIMSRIRSKLTVDRNDSTGKTFTTKEIRKDPSFKPINDMIQEVDEFSVENND